MVSEEVKREGWAALRLAAVELIEDHHDELVMTMPEYRGVQQESAERLRRLGADLLALGEAGLVLLEHRAGE